MKLASNVTGLEINCGEILHAQTGPTAGRAWRFEGIAERPIGAHHVHVSRSGGKLGRIHREYHPGVFGCEIKIDVTWRQRTKNRVQRMRTKIDDYLMAGAFALVPLALFEHFHLAEPIAAALTVR
jgi:hypothetical protein